jgi:hypothetical protein
MKSRLLGILLLVVWGFAKIPLEVRISENMRHRQLGDFKVMANVRQQLGQAGFLAVFGGLRSAVADLIYIGAHVVWEKAQYGKMKEYFDICTALQPRSELYWDMAGWHMAWNAAAYVEMRDTTIKDPVERDREIHNYRMLGRDYLLQGIANIPESSTLHEHLGMLYRDKMHDSYRASLEYDKAAQLPGHLGYVPRLAAIYLAEVPGHEREAYERLLTLYKQGEKEWLPSLLKKLQLMERKLGIPKDQQVYIPPKDRLPPE